MPSRTLLPLCACALFAILIGVDDASAQQARETEWRAAAGVQELIGRNHYRFFKDVSIEQGGTRLFADQAELFGDEDRVVASGNVVVSQTADGLTIAADRVEFNLRTRTGTFYNARGSANIKSRPQVSSGGFAPPASAEPTDVYFFGEVLQKTGSRSYRISNGGFTTCVQPTPRWDLHAGTVDLKIDDYTLLRNAVFKVKNVPLFYLPVLYYPTKDEDRSTGFLLPTWGTSNLRGQSIGNAFFWAINRSHDAMFTHDWYSRTGNGYGGQYRYNLGVGDGSLRAYLLDERSTTFAVPGGEAATSDRRTFDIRGGASHQLPLGLRARGHVDYSSDIITMQSFYTNVNDFTRNSRRFGGNVVGSWSGYSLNAIIDHSESFYDARNSVVYGSTPRVSVNKSESALLGGPVYFSMTSEFAGIDRETRIDGTTSSDSGLTRFDIAPQLSIPFKRWQWLTATSTLSWRDTFYSRSRALPGEASAGQIIDDNLTRRYFTLAARIVGPVFNKVWDTPGSGYAERFKHTVEPFLNFSRTSSIDDYDRIVQTDGIDAVVGNASNFNYGINNRFYAKRRVASGQSSQAQEILSVAVTQTYYTDQRSAQYDQQYSTANGGAPPSHFSPIYVNLNATPATSFNSSMRAELDSRHWELRTMSLGANYNWGGLVSTGGGWSKRFFIEGLPGFDNPDQQDQSLNVTTNVRTSDNKYGGTYSLTYDIFRGYFVTQNIQAFYNAQCCGIAMQYLQSGVATPTFPKNRTFFVSFTLAGLGNFSPFSGALGAIPR